MGFFKETTFNEYFDRKTTEHCDFTGECLIAMSNIFIILNKLDWIKYTDNVKIVFSTKSVSKYKQEFIIKTGLPYDMNNKLWISKWIIRF